jgi:hypothetical protein
MFMRKLYFFYGMLAASLLWLALLAGGQALAGRPGPEEPHAVPTATATVAPVPGCGGTSTATPTVTLTVVSPEPPLRVPGPTQPPIATLPATVVPAVTPTSIAAQP